VSAEPVPEEAELRVVPPERVPGLNPLARGLAAKDGSVEAFLPDPPELGAIAARAKEALQRFAPRDPARAEPGLSDLVAGRRAGVFTGQQVGLFTGPLLALAKALAAGDLAAELGRTGTDAAPVFWCASEDHDLVEITRLAVPGPMGIVHKGPDPAPLAENRRPVGALPIELDVPALLEEAAALVGKRDEDALAALASLSSGKTYREGFVGTLGWILGDAAPPTVDAARREDKPDLVPLAARLLRESFEVQRILDERAERLKAAGYALQVKTDPSALPLFAVVDGERWLLKKDGARLSLKGHPEERAWDVEEVVAHFEAGRWLPSFSALTRPLAQSRLFPVAAVILGPAEIAYWAQSLPLFDWAGIVRPVIVPRPMAALVEAPVRRALEKLGLSYEQALQSPDELLKTLGAQAVSGLLGRLEDVRKDSVARLDALRAELLSVDDALGKALDATKEKIEFSLGKLEERAASAAGRQTESLAQKVARVSTALAPEGTLAERVYGPVPYLMSLGREGFLAAMKRAVSWERFGLTAVDA
jgi:bacillithiol biosynthesis cysteine-adding enzyme BshC